MSVAQSVVDTHQPESIRSRYLVTIVSQFLQMGISVLTAGIVPRALGPANYGAYNFISNTSALIRNYLQPSTQQAFFTLSSQDKRSGALTKLYGIMLLIQMAFVFAMMGVAGLAHVTDWLWPDQTLDHILLISLAEWVLFWQAMLRQLSSSKGLIIRAQIIGLVMTVVSTISLLVMNAGDWLNLYTYIGLNLSITIVSSVALGYYLLHVKRELTWVGSVREHAREYIQRWWQYASPLILLEYYVPLVAYLSTYLIQRWYGSAEQGYLALSFRWSQYVLVFTTSALSIVWREIAHSMAKGDREGASRVYLKFNYSLFFLTLVLSLWLSIGSPTIVTTLAGDKYQFAVPVLAIMAFYPLAQTYGQLNVAAIKASSNTTLHRNLALFFSVPDIILTYFLLAPTDAPLPGLGLGALGVAINLTGYGLLRVQIYEWYACRVLAVDFWAMFYKKVAAFLFIGPLAFLFLHTLNNWLQIQIHIADIFTLAISSLAYFITLVALVLVRPPLAGLQRTDIISLKQAVIDRLHLLGLR